MIINKTILNINAVTLKAEILASTIAAKFTGVVGYNIDEDEVLLEFTEALDATEEDVLDTLITNHDSTPTPLSLEDVYAQRETDGVGYYRTVQAQLAKDYFDGNTDFATTRAIETKLEKVVALLVRGNWMSAKDELENNVVIDAADLTVALRDFILSGINDYITNNY